MRGFCLVLLLLSTFRSVSGKYASGVIKTGENLALISQFFFIDEIRQLDFQVEYKVTNQCCPSLAYYHKDSWESVYYNNNLDCETKSSYALAVLTFQNTPSRSTSSGNNSIQCFVNNATNLRQCSGTLRLYSVDDRWWSFVFTHCNSSQGLDISYEFKFTNGDFWDEPTEQWQLQILNSHVIALGLILLLFAIGLYFGRQLLRRDMFHRAYKLFMATLSYELVALLFKAIYRMYDSRVGVELAPLLTIGNLLHATSEIFLVVLLVLLAFGWTITSAHLSQSTQMKLTVFASLYILAYGILFVFKQRFLDSGQSFFLVFDSFHLASQGLKVVAWAWFVYGAISTVKHYPEKKKFYLSFAAFYSIWFLMQPLTLLLSIISAFLLDKWRSVQIFRILDPLHYLLCLLGFGRLLHIMHPSRANVNFPFHTRTDGVEPSQEQNPPTTFQHADGFSRISHKDDVNLEFRIPADMGRVGGNDGLNRFGFR